MNILRCLRCRHWWATTGYHPDRITSRFCPDCIPHLLPVLPALRAVT